jgi:hypothetical protein
VYIPPPPVGTPSYEHAAKIFPSGVIVTQFQSLLAGSPFVAAFQLTPESLLMYIFPETRVAVAAASIFPLELDAAEYHIALVGTLLFVTRVQLTPALLLVYNPPTQRPTTSFVPSEFIARAFHVGSVGIPVDRGIQLAPESLLIYIPTPNVPLAAKFFPSLLIATEYHCLLPEDVGLQAKSVPVPVALLPSPDLSLQVVINAPLVAGIPVAFGSAASNHRVQPGT